MPRDRFVGRPGAANEIGRVDVSEPASISAGIADRYATAIFEICKEGGSLDQLEGNLDDLKAALSESADLNELIRSPILTRDEQGRGIAAIGDKMGLVDALKNGLGLMAQKRRLFVMPQLINTLLARIAKHKGEVTAEVVSAKALTKAQSDKLSKTLADKFGQTVKINATVDDALIGGLIVKVGSKMIDTSIRSKLDSLQNTMKEAR